MVDSEESFRQGGFVKKTMRFFGAGVLLVLLIAGCSLAGPLTADVIVGSWQQVSVNGTAAITVNVVKFTADTYTTSLAGVTTNTGTWTKSGSSYTLNGAFFGFVATTATITPTFSNSNNTLSYVDGSGYVEIFNRQ